MSKFNSHFIAVVSMLSIALSANAGFTVTYENAGVLNTTATFDYTGVETFDSRSIDTNQTFTTDFGTSSDPIKITGTYKNVQIMEFDQYGGAGNSGNYAVALRTGASYDLELSAEDNDGAVPITYFGYWLSALDAGNQVDFYRGNDLLFTFDPTTVINAIGSCSGATNLYCGKPETNPIQNPGEQYVFVNFYDDSGVGFDRIHFYETNAANGGYESDNHTVGYYKEKGGNLVEVPEPASLLLVGLALLGMSGVRRYNSK